MAQPYLITVVLNTNRKQDTLECLESLSNCTYSNHKILVLDNHSTDGSVEAIKENFPLVQIIELMENRGYAGNNNVGIVESMDQGADWIFVLNEDTILSPDCLTKLIAHGESDNKIGIVGPIVYHHDKPDMIQSAGGMLGPYWQSIHLYQNHLDQGQLVGPRQVEWISGCSIMLRRELIEEIGLIDERYFYYWEETEWCIRARKNGWQIMLVPEAKLWHKGVQSDYKPKPSITYYATRNRLLTLQKHKAPLKVWLFTWWQIFRTLTSWTIKSKWRSMREHRKAMWSGMIDFFRGRWGQMPR